MSVKCAKKIQMIKKTDDQETGDTKTNSVYYTEYGTRFIVIVCAQS